MGEFNTKQTWLQIRSQGLRLDWTRCIWFSHATPKYSVINGWMGNWSTHHTSQHFMHSLQCSNRNHIFFECGDWNWSLWKWMEHDSGFYFMLDSSRNKTTLFLTLSFSDNLSITCGECVMVGNMANRVSLRDWARLQKAIDKQFRNRISSISAKWERWNCCLSQDKY